MIKKVTICKCPNVVYAKFDTKIESEGKDKGRRVRHLIYPDDEGLGYWHEMRYLSEDALTVKPTRKFDLVISVGNMGGIGLSRPLKTIRMSGRRKNWKTI